MIRKGKLRLTEENDLFQITYQLVAKLGRDPDFGTLRGHQGVRRENQPGSTYYLPVALGKHSDTLSLHFLTCKMGLIISYLKEQ